MTAEFSTGPRLPEPDPRKRRFNLAMCERLGLDAGEVLDVKAEVRTEDEDWGRVTVTVAVSADEILGMWMAAAASAETRLRVAAQDALKVLCNCGGDLCSASKVRAQLAAAMGETP